MSSTGFVAVKKDRRVDDDATRGRAAESCRASSGVLTTFAFCAGLPTNIDNKLSKTVELTNSEDESNFPGNFQLREFFFLFCIHEFCFKVVRIEKRVL